MRNLFGDASNQVFKRICKSRRLNRFSTLFSLGFAALVLSPTIMWAGATTQRITIENEVRAQQAALEQKAEEYRETVCLTNVIWHEVRGEKNVWDITARVVLAMRSDPATKVRTVCDLALRKGIFSNIKVVTEVRADREDWPSIFSVVDKVYYGDRRLPNGWGCVRAFRLSDDVLESLSSKALKQLGITQTAKGLKYHAESFVPVDTRGKVTYYSPRGGCKFPTPTT